MSEGFELAKDNTYQPPISDYELGSPAGIPDKAYRDAAKQVAEGDVSLAGYRLAMTLNEALGKWNS